jgi:hypothetical protein
MLFALLRFTAFKQYHFKNHQNFLNKKKKFSWEVNFCNCNLLDQRYEKPNRIGGVIVSVLASSAVDRGF